MSAVIMGDLTLYSIESAKNFCLMIYYLTVITWNAINSTFM